MQHLTYCIRTIFPLAFICLLYPHISCAQTDTAFIIKPKFIYHSIAINKYGVNGLNFHHTFSSPKTYYLKSADSIVLTKYNPFPFTNYTYPISTLKDSNDFFESFIAGYAAGFPQSMAGNIPNTTVNNSKSTFIGFTLGFLSSGIMGGLFNKHHNNNGIPPFYNDFINFNRH